MSGIGSAEGFFVIRVDGVWFNPNQILFVDSYQVEDRAAKEWVTHARVHWIHRDQPVGFAMDPDIFIDRVQEAVAQRVGSNEVHADARSDR